jgi:hypothetical protein
VPFYFEKEKNRKYCCQDPTLRFKKDGKSGEKASFLFYISTQDSEEQLRH